MPNLASNLKKGNLNLKIYNMKKLLLLPLLGLCTLNAQAVRQPMEGRFDFHKALKALHGARLDSIRTLGEWGGWVDSMAFYKYDESGRLTDIEGYNGNSVKVNKLQVTYNADGSFVLKETTSNDGNTPSHIYTYNYNKDKQLTEMQNVSVDGKYTQHTSISYKKKKGLLTETCTSNDGGDNSVTVYNANGDIKSITTADGVKEYEYNEHNKLVSIAEIKNGKKNYLVQKEYAYNNHDQISGITTYTKKGEKVDTLKESFQYNADNQVIRRIVGNSFTDYTYNNVGNVIMETKIENDNIYGAKNKTYFYKTTPTTENPSQTYDLSRYPKGSAVATYGKLRVKNSQLCDMNGKPVQLRGMSTHGVQWFTNIYTNPNAISTLVDSWNINVLRIAMYVQESGYATGAVKSDNEWNTYIDSVSNLCAKKGIYCIIDWHILTPGDPLADANYSKAMQFWNYMSKKHAKDAHVLYEICNEPNGGDVSWPRVREYGRKIIEAIRVNDKNSVVLVGTPVWSQDIDVAALAQIEDSDVMYTLHFYAGSHGKSFRQRGDRAMQAPYKAPIFITEFGTSDASGDNGFFKDATIDWLTWASKHNLSWCNWSFADKGESASALQKDAASNGWNSLTESGSLIRCVLRDPSMKSVTNCLDELKQKN